MKIKKACVISGGGAWGAYGGGTLARINANYDLVVGVSTGSLLAPLVGLKEWEILKNAYTSIDNKNIFDLPWYKPTPITKSGKIRKFSILMTLLFGHKSMYSSNALRKTIDDYFTENHFRDLQKQKKEILVGTQNYAQSPSKIHYFSSLDEEFEDFKDWMWCSANLPFFTSLVKKCWRDDSGNFHVGLWGDGGLTDLIGINQLIGKGFDEIDIILHRIKNIDIYEGRRISNLIENIASNINAMKYDIEFECFYEKIKILNRQGAKVNIYWLPRKLSLNSMIFNPNEMSKWWDEGYKTAYDSNRIETFQRINRTY